MHLPAKKQKWRGPKMEFKFMSPILNYKEPGSNPRIDGLDLQCCYMRSNWMLVNRRARKMRGTVSLIIVEKKKHTSPNLSPSKDECTY
jgi:hypothetical protein